MLPGSGTEWAAQIERSQFPVEMQSQTPVLDWDSASTPAYTEPEMLLSLTPEAQVR
jgi:hypothetical protein